MDKVVCPRHPIHLKTSVNLLPAVLPDEGFYPSQDAICRPSKHAETCAPGEVVESASPALYSTRNPHICRHLLSESSDEPSEPGFDECGRFLVQLAIG